ncbi:hypothetical protein H1W37_18095 [Stappia taiwanensis]|uniref:TolB amino-terminal domain-containing protein n=1 Tax=Stappia taiwanensis TaxID=992267 RepID=A0A838Y310_9HYPH|nr:hypothetical protein [Stappia taiwanensis]MBA4613574.1 hypothetical protein [Stappia taiwanensis]GGE99066.1 hypothetical protein GCM10007285_28310 [Stappia taiwanensis]
MSISDSFARTAFSEGEIRKQLARILAFPEFQASDRRRDMLAFVVDEALAGRASGIKATTIAMAVFDRGADFDQQADPVVRLEARKLRRDLDNYYADAGQNDPIRISIPKGAYVPKFAAQATGNAALARPEAVTRPARPDTPPSADTEAPPMPATPASRRWRPLHATAGAGILVLALLAIVMAKRPVSIPSQDAAAVPVGGVKILMEGFDTRSADDLSTLLASGLSHELAASLLRFPDLRVHLMAASGDADPAIATGAEEAPNTDFTVSGTVWRETDEVLVRAELVRRRDGQVLWSDRFIEGAEGRSLTDIQDAIAGEIAAVVGQQYGHAMRDIRQTLAADGSDPSLRGFACVASAQIYRRTYRSEAYQAARDCLEQTVLDEPNYGRAWAMLAYLRNDAARFGHDSERTRDEAFAHARAAALRALDINPSDTDALQAMSHIEQYAGDLDRSIAFAQRAVEENPNDPAVLANLGYRYGMVGSFDKAVPLLERAIDLSLAPAPFYFHMIAMDHMMKEEWDDMLVNAERAVADGSALSHALLAIAHAGLSNEQAARDAYDYVAGRSPLLAEDPRAWLEPRRLDPEVIDAIEKGIASVRSHHSQ